MAAGEPDDRRAVVFDLDRTLIGCDSFAGCLNGLLLRDWWRVGAVIAVSPLLLPLWFTDTTRPAALRGLLWCATVGLDRSVFDAALVDQGRHIASDPGSSIYAEGLQTVRRHLDAGDRVIIVTGSSGILARTLCDRLGLCDVIVVVRRSGRGPADGCSTSIAPANGRSRRWSTRAPHLRGRSSTPTVHPICHCCALPNSGAWSIRVPVR